MKKIILLLSICFVGFSVKAQQTAVDYPRDKWVINVPVLSIFDFTAPSLNVGVEYRAHHVLGLHLEAGYINKWINPLYGAIEQGIADNNSRNGLKFRLDPKLYPFYKSRSAFGSTLFFAPSFEFRYIKTDRSDFVWRYNRSYRQKINYATNRLAYAVNLKFGFTVSPQKKVPATFSFGLGARYIDVSNNLPKDASFDGRGFIFNRNITNAQFWFPSAYIGISLNFPVKKKANKPKSIFKEEEMVY